MQEQRRHKNHRNSGRPDEPPMTSEEVAERGHGGRLVVTMTVMVPDPISRREGVGRHASPLRARRAGPCGERIAWGRINTGSSR